jgi:hypothetical protein
MVQSSPWVTFIFKKTDQRSFRQVIYIASMAVGGLTYIVERIDGVWQVVGDTGVRWMA